MIETGNIRVVNTYYNNESLFSIIQGILEEEYPKNTPECTNEEQYKWWLRSRGYIWVNHRVLHITNRQKYDTNFFCKISENYFGEQHDYVLVFKEDKDNFTDYTLDLLEEQLEESLL